MRKVVAEVRRVLITGGAGFIGSHYVRYAREHHPEWEIVVLDKLTYAGSLETLRDVADQISFVRGDIASPEDVANAMIGADAVLNFAAETHVDRSLLAPHSFVRTNVEGTLVLLEHARRAGVRRFLHVSTDEVYGDLSGTDQHSVETDTLEPRSPYAATKAAAEHLVFSYGSSYGLDVVVTRGSNTYGPYQYPEKIIPLFITNALDDRRLPVYGDGSAVRDYLHVEDHCRGIDLVLHHGRSGEAYNLGARLEISGLQVARQVLALLAKSVDLIEHVADRPGHDYRYSVDPTKAESLGWARVWAFPQGLAQTVEWYVRTPGWWKPIKQSLDFQQHERKGSRNLTA
jgi:dTDP-glucose 4,6-dehydratase